MFGSQDNTAVDIWLEHSRHHLYKVEHELRIGVVDEYEVRIDAACHFRSDADTFVLFSSIMIYFANATLRVSRMTVILI